jgi:hypothetical protein
MEARARGNADGEMSLAVIRQTASAWVATESLAIRVARRQLRLADAHMKYLSTQAMLTADHQKLQRTGKLVAIGAASVDAVTRRPRSAGQFLPAG